MTIIRYKLVIVVDVLCKMCNETEGERITFKERFMEDYSNDVRTSAMLC